MKKWHFLNFLLFNFFCVSLCADIAKKLPADFAEKHRSLFAALVDAEKICMTNSGHITIVDKKSDLPFRFSYFQGNYWLSKMSRLPSRIVRAGVAKIHQGIDYLYGGKVKDDVGYQVKEVLIQSMRETRTNFGLDVTQTACMAACVSRQMVKYRPSLASFKTLFASPERVLAHQNGLCYEQANVFAAFAHSLGIPAYDFPQQGALFSLIQLSQISLIAGLTYSGYLTSFFHALASSSLTISYGLAALALNFHHSNYFTIGEDRFIFEPFEGFEVNKEEGTYRCVFNQI